MYIALFLGALSASKTYSQETERFVVKISSGNSKDPKQRAKIRAANTEFLQEELIEDVEGVEDTVALSKVGVLIVEGDANAIKESLQDHPLVEYVEKDITWKINEFTQLGNTQIPGDSVDLPSAQSRNPWLAQFTGLTASQPDYDTSVAPSPITVAVVDSGANYNHPYLAPAIAANSTEQSGTPGVDDDGNGYVDDIYGANTISYNGDVATDSSHGTHVAGLVKTVRDQAIGMGYSDAAKVRILPVKFISGGSGSTSNAIAALNYAAARGAKVINCSWGAGGHSAYSQALYDTMAGLYNSDIVISVAAGNNGSNNDNYPYFPAGYNIPSLLSVGSLTADHSGGGASVSRSYFSNYGSNTVDLMAVGSMKDTFGNSGGVISSYSSYISAGAYWVKMQGTSMAAPVVAGVAGVIRALNTSLTNYEVKQRIIDTGTVSSESSSTKSGKRINAAAAFSGVAALTSSGTRPGISGAAYYNMRSSEDEPTWQESRGGKVGGCGLIAPMGPGNPPSGPFGGNSMGLMAAAYFLYLAFKKATQKKLFSSRSN